VIGYFENEWKYFIIGEQIETWNNLSGCGEIQIDISKNPPGNYFVRISSGENIFSQEVIKQ